MTQDVLVDAESLRSEVRDKYRAVAIEPAGGFHFHTGRPLAARFGYDADVVDACRMRRLSPSPVLPIPSPCAASARRAGGRCGLGGGLRLLRRCGTRWARGPGRRGRHDAGDAGQVPCHGRASSASLVEFREGLAEALPVDDGWADAVISNGVINLCADKRAVFAEMWRVLRPGGVLQFADIANGRPVPAEALRDIDLWTG